MYVVTGVTGHTGAATAEALLARGETVRVVVRSADKASALRARGAEVVVADLLDSKGLTEALRGARGAYFLVPPPYQAPDVAAASAQFTTAIAAAIDASALPHAVFLSSVGAGLPSGNGIVGTLHEAERRLGALGRPITFLRAAYFMENWASVLGPARGGGALPTGLLIDRPMSMVSVRDIGEAAARALLDPAPGVRVVELEGPSAYSPRDVAMALGHLIGRPVAPVQVPLTDLAGALGAAGFSADAAAKMCELTAGLNSGHVAIATGAWRGKVSLEEALRGLIG